MKFNKLFIPVGLLISATALSSTFSRGDALKYLYNAYFGEMPSYYDPNIQWPIDGGYGAPKYPNTFTHYRDETPRYVESGKYLHEPSVNLSGVIRSWSDEHAQTCPQTSKYKKMPFTNAADSWVQYYIYGKPSISIKSFNVNQNVPHRFTAKRHGGLTDLLSDSFYFWSFGDGMRRFNKQGDNYAAEHRYPFLGTYIISSIVYSEELYFGIQVSYGLDGSFSLSNQDFKPILTNDTIYLEGCDIAEVNVIPNNAPNARIYSSEIATSSSVTTFSFNASNSTDPDGNPLTYTWSYSGISKSGKAVTFHFPRDDSLTKPYTVTLTVTDGDKSDITNRTVYISPYCATCNGGPAEY